MKSKLTKQGWQEHQDYIQIDLHQPFWAAGKKYGWEGEGFGISAEAIKYADSIGKNIRINVFRYDTWQISPKEVFELSHKYNSVFVTASGTTLIIIPRINCQKIEGQPKPIGKEVQPKPAEKEIQPKQMEMI